MKIYLLVLLLFCSLLVQAQEKDMLEFVSGTITFEIKNAGIKVDGRMEGVDASIIFNPRKPQKGNISGSADPSTIETGIGMRDKHLKNDDYFDVENYPQISMSSRSLTKGDDGNFSGIFTLTIKEYSQELTLPFTVTEENDELIFTTSLEINRQDFGLGGNSLILSDDVKINIELKAH